MTNERLESPVQTYENPLNKAKAILDDLEKNLEKRRATWLNIKLDNPNFEQLSDQHWRDKSSRCWLHGGTDILESNGLEHWLFHKVSLSKLAQQEVKPLILLWRKRNNEKGPWGTYYSDDPRFNLKSLPQENLINFILRNATNVEEKGKGHRLSWRALKSFLCFLQETQDQTEIAFIEQIFPKKMDLKHGRIIRKIPAEVYAIPFQRAGDLIRALAKLCKTSRQDAQLGILETIGLCWLCLTASRLRLPTEVSMLINTRASAIDFSGELPTILIPTFFGDQKIIISKRVANFLHALSLIESKKPRETILQKPLRSLSRILEKTLEADERLINLGNVTFLTLISPPHIHGEDYRFMPKKPLKTT